MGNAFAVVKAVDNQRHGHFLETLDKLKVENRFLNAQDRLKYVYKYPTEQDLQGAKLMSEVVPQEAERKKV